MQIQLAPPDELIVQRSRRVRARRGQLDLERAALIARGSMLRARAQQATLHAQLVCSAAGYTLLQSGETPRPQRPLPPPSGDVPLPVAAFSELVVAFLEEMAGSQHGDAALVCGDTNHASAHLDQMLSLIARGRELQRRPAHLALLPPAPAHERHA